MQMQTVAHAAADGILEWVLQNIVPLVVQAIREGRQAGEAVAPEGADVGNAGFNQAAAAGNLMAQGPRGAGQAAPTQVGPFPHGDVDLRFMGPNVAPNVRPVRGGHSRQFYFLDNPDAPVQVPQKAVADDGGRGRRVAAPGGAVVKFTPG
jgi:hypothetical protein